MSSYLPFASHPYHDSNTSALWIPSSLLENSLSFRAVSIQLKVIQAFVNIFATVFNKISVDLWRGVFFKQASWFVYQKTAIKSSCLSHIKYLFKLTFATAFDELAVDFWGGWFPNKVLMKIPVCHTFMIHLIHFMPHCKQNFRPARSSSLIMTFRCFSSYISGFLKMLKSHQGVFSCSRSDM